MALVGRLHPLLIHFPIALVLSGFAAEAVAILTGRAAWRGLAVASVRWAAILAALAAYAGWRLADDPNVIDPTPLLEWHRWLAVTGTAATVVAALASTRLHPDSKAARWGYRISLLVATALVGVAAHLGGVLVWGDNFLRP
jgi:uncharacterized membrane protein